MITAYFYSLLEYNLIYRSRSQPRGHGDIKGRVAKINLNNNEIFCEKYLLQNFTRQIEKK